MFGKKENKIEEPKKEDNAVIPGNESKEDWMTKKWRPMMAMMYMLCCLADFAIFPIMFTIVQFWETQAANDAFRQWVPITLQGGGLFHVAMGAVLGVSAFGRTQEKIAGAAGNGVQTPTLSSEPPKFTSESAPLNSNGMVQAQAPRSQMTSETQTAYLNPAPMPISQPVSNSDSLGIRPIVRRPI
ncbi:MAG: hypothetical protein EB127_16900 [Alphaproteobacteria bacterium]|nr:hypothetical protein [Alphaproteobacteria bacterium]